MHPATRTGILAGGLWLIDSTKHIDHYPAPSRLATVREVVRSNGGGAFNLAVNLSQLGAEFPIGAVGLIGDDENGRWIEEICRSRGITTRGLRRASGQPTSCTDVMTEAGTGRRTFFYLPGANAHLGPADFHFDDTSSRIFYLGYPGLLPALDAVGREGRSGVAELLARAKGAGLVTAVDLVSADSCDWPAIGGAIPQADVLFANEWEAARLLGRNAVDETTVSAVELQEMAAALLQRGVNRVAVVHCSRGAVCVSSDGDRLKRGAVKVPPAEIRGTCGAGDALAAGFLLALHRGDPWDACLELALSAAATCLHHLTSSQGVRSWRECLAYGRRAGFQEF